MKPGAGALLGFRQLFGASNPGGAMEHGSQGTFQAPKGDQLGLVGWCRSAFRFVVVEAPHKAQKHCNQSKLYNSRVLEPHTRTIHADGEQYF